MFNILLEQSSCAFSWINKRHDNGTYTSVRIALCARTMESSSAPLLETSVRVVHDYSQKKKAVSCSETLLYITICPAECPRRRAPLPMSS